ncbi:protein translocase subunit SecF [bacterium]|nr:protein translocase subunit SecF [bacterium]
MTDFIKYSRLYFAFSGILILASIVFLSLWGLRFGIDFTGGTLLEVEFIKERPAISDLRKTISEKIQSDFTLQEVGEKGVILRAKEISEETHQKIIESLGGEEKVREKRFEMIGPSIGRELKKEAITALAFGFLFIIVYIAFAFRRVSRPVSSFKYGLAALIALFHDILITCGIFAFLGRFFNIEVNTPFAAALLTILGYSINDTIVVFDRCRENLIKSEGGFKEILNRSLSQSIARSLFTSLSTLLVLFAVLLWGGETLFSFSLALIVGIILGTYSSIFIAAPILFRFYKK